MQNSIIIQLHSFKRRLMLLRFFTELTKMKRQNSLKRLKLGEKLKSDFAAGLIFTGHSLQIRTLTLFENLSFLALITLCVYYYCSSYYYILVLITVVYVLHLALLLYVCYAACCKNIIKRIFKRYKIPLLRFLFHAYFPFF